MKRKIAVFTGTRAEYGLLYWLIRELQESPAVNLQLIVGAMHLSPEFGETWRVIEEDGFHIDAKVEFLLSSDSAVGVAKSMGLGTIGFADVFARLEPDVLIVLGDRFEALAIAQTALVMRIPIAHIHGGELTEGAFDDAIRHSITKMSSLHFVATEEYRRRVIQMGENPKSVHNFGAIGLDHIKRSSRMSPTELSQSLGFDASLPFILLTYHPVTLLEEEPVSSIKALLGALEQFPDYRIIITYPNSDNGGRAIIPVLENFASENSDRVVIFPSLGFKRYLSAMPLAAAVVGNSSSGIIEAPSFGVPTVNIGVRQKGRLAADSVIHCDVDALSIEAALHKALSADFRAACKHVENPYGAGNASQAIARCLEGFTGTSYKSFYDLG